MIPCVIGDKGDEYIDVKVLVSMATVMEQFGELSAKIVLSESILLQLGTVSISVLFLDTVSNIDCVRAISCAGKIEFCLSILFQSLIVCNIFFY